ncbi:MAG TPA: diacylglycerol kinase family protein, partial [Ktedonobacterales bacterium]
MHRPVADQTPRSTEVPARQSSARPPGQRPVLVLFNPAARTAVAGAIIADTIRDRLGQHGIVCEVIETASEADAREHAARAATSGAFGAVVAAGGDGTVHAVVQGLLRGHDVRGHDVRGHDVRGHDVRDPDAPGDHEGPTYGKRDPEGPVDGDSDYRDSAVGGPGAPRPVALGILPLGTMNNIAHSLGIPESLDDACEVLAHADPRPVDVGTVNGQLFVEVVGAGLEALLVPWADALKGHLWRHPAAPLRLLGLLRRVRAARVALDLDGQQIATRALQVTVCNAPRYGLSFAAAPDARMDDGWLDVVVYAGDSAWPLIGHYWRMLGGRRDTAPGVRRFRARAIRITPHSAPWPVHTDGTPATTTPATIRVLPGALTVITPPAPEAAAERPALTPAAALLRAAAPPAATITAQATLGAASHTADAFSSSLASSAETVRHALEAGSDEARAIVGVEPPRRSARRARAVRYFYLSGLAGSLALTYAVRRANLLPGDLRITRAMQRRRSPLRDAFWRMVAAPGFPRLSTPLVAAAAAGFWGLRLRTEAGFLLLASGTNAANWAIKRLVRRERPDVGLVHVARVINEPGFPSGHVMHYLSFYGFLAAAALANLRPTPLRRGLVGTCLAMIGLVGPSRVYLGAHWPSDVAAGYLYGGLYLGGLLQLYAAVKQREAAQ